MQHISAFIESDSDQPTVYVKNRGSGGLITATNGSSGVSVANDGSLSIGTIGSPQITLDAASGDITLAGDVTVSGTVRNAAGDAMLPVAWLSYYWNPFGGGYVVQKSQNVVGVTESQPGFYEIQFTDLDITISPVVQASMFWAGGDQSISYGPSPADDTISVITTVGGNLTSYSWSFVLYRP